MAHSTALAMGSDEVIVIEEPKNLWVGPVDPSALIPSILMLCAPAVLLVPVSVSPYGAWAQVLAGVVLAIHLSRMQGQAALIEKIRNAAALTYLGLLIVACGVEWLCFGPTGANLAGVAVSIGLFVFTRNSIAEHIEKLKGPQPVSRIKTSRTHMMSRRATMVAALGTLKRLEVFSTQQEDLLAAWERKNIEKIESLLREGDMLSDSSKETGMALYNAAVADVDLAKGRLRYELSESERILARFNIDFSLITVPRSGRITGDMPVVTRERFMTEKLNYGHAAGVALTRVTSGQLPWQVAAIAGAGMTVWHLANRSKIFRQLKEMEGELSRQAAAVKGQLKLIRSLIETRLIPQFDGLTEVANRLEDQRTPLAVGDATMEEERRSQMNAFRLACSLMEGKQLLKTLGGD